MKVTPVLISFHTNGWIQEYTRQHLSHFPNHKILVVDNNPLPNQKVNYTHHTWCKREKSYNFSSSWRKSCDQEREWTSNHPSLTVIQAPNPTDSKIKRLLQHGEAIDLAIEWLKSNNTDIMLHVEPDCVMKGSRWYHQLLNPILEEKSWSTFGEILPTGIGHICPSMWKINKLNHKFHRRPKGTDESEPHYSKAFTPVKKWTDGYWDTGQKCWYEFDKLGKAQHVKLRDFTHLREGSCTPYQSCIKLL